MFTVYAIPTNDTFHELASPTIRQEKTVWLRSLAIRPARPEDGERIIHLIDVIAGERQYLQTERYCPTPIWEQLLRECISRESGLLLLVVEVQKQVVGFARLTPDREHPLGRSAGNIGIALLPAYRSRRIGTFVLSQLMACAASLGFQTVTANILATNVRSLRLFQKYGFVLTKTRNIYLPFTETEVEEVTVEYAQR